VKSQAYPTAVLNNQLQAKSKLPLLVGADSRGRRSGWIEARPDVQSSRIAGARNPRRPAAAASTLPAAVVKHRRGISLTLHNSQRRSLCNVDEPADVEIGHVVQDLPVGCHVRGRKTSVISGEKKLPDFFLDAHLAERGFHPGVRAGRPIFHRALCGGYASFTTVLFAEVLWFWLRAL